jgi:hypothetical protein
VGVVSVIQGVILPAVETDPRQELLTSGDGTQILPPEWRDPVRTFSPEDRARILRKSGGHCTHCDEPLGDVWHADHYPFAHAVGGRTIIANGVASCAPCNLRR